MRTTCIVACLLAVLSLATPTLVASDAESLRSDHSRYIPTDCEQELFQDMAPRPRRPDHRSCPQ